MIVLVPIPTGELESTRKIWEPFLHRIAGSGEDFNDLLAMVLSNEVQPLIAWDAEAKEAVAMAGSRIVGKNGALRGELVWCVGDDMARWAHLIEQIEQYHKDLGCVGMRAICRPGWKRTLKDYRMTHVMLEKDF